MNRIIVVMFAVLLGGCYTQLQIPDRETASAAPYVPPQPIIIVVPTPYFPPQPCPVPRPDPPAHPVVVLPAKPVVTPPAESGRIRTTGATRDSDTRRSR